MFIIDTIFESLIKGIVSVIVGTIKLKTHYIIKTLLLYAYLLIGGAIMTFLAIIVSFILGSMNPEANSFTDLKILTDVLFLVVSLLTSIHGLIDVLLMYNVLNMSLKQLFFKNERKMIFSELLIFIPSLIFIITFSLVINVLFTEIWFSLLEIYITISSMSIFLSTLDSVSLFIGFILQNTIIINFTINFIVIISLYNNYFSSRTKNIIERVNTTIEYEHYKDKERNDRYTNVENGEWKEYRGSKNDNQKNQNEFFQDLLLIGVYILLPFIYGVLMTPIRTIA